MNAAANMLRSVLNTSRAAMSSGRVRTKTWGTWPPPTTLRRSLFNAEDEEKALDAQALDYDAFAADLRRFARDVKAGKAV